MHKKTQTNQGVFHFHETTLLKNSIWPCFFVERQKTSPTHPKKQLSKLSPKHCQCFTLLFSPLNPNEVMFILKMMVSAMKINNTCTKLKSIDREARDVFLHPLNESASASVQVFSLKFNFSHMSIYF